jgi:hypothetical protein
LLAGVFDRDDFDVGDFDLSPGPGGGEPPPESDRLAALLAGRSDFDLFR